MSADSDTKLAQLQTAILGVLAFVLGCAALRAAQIVVVPVVLAGFIALLVQPGVRRLQAAMPYWLALSIVLAGLLGGLIMIWIFIAGSVQAVMEKGPAYVDRISQYGDALASALARAGVDISAEEVQADDLLRLSLDVFVASVMPILTGIGVMTLVAFNVVLMLLEADSLNAKIKRGLRDESSAEFFAGVRSVTRHFQRFFVVKTWISLVTGALTTLFTWLLGVDFPFIWGALAFMLNYVPNVGSMIAVIPPVVIACLQFPGIGRGVVTLAGLTGIQMTIGNFFDPRVMGRSLALSPLAVFVAMVFWGWLWGVIGVFLSVPLTVLMKLVFEHVDALRPLAVLLGEDLRRVPVQAPPAPVPAVEAAPEARA
ncbi:MAG: AI-2E family transporter [Myxococcales bacterium]|nr:AI-2E family transporter [Myxococcales bacterium]MCB9520753.1 AI-2E family transporter [Myxococcales bacterium]MCB9533470.1 AI-2E family transporter [Myxococcales bacterium]